MRTMAAAWLALAGSTLANGQSVPAPATSVATLASVTVSAEQPGPGLWKVSRGGHVMWVLGTPGPLPAHFQWRSAETVGKLLQAQEVVLSPGLEVSSSLGFFGKLALLPRLIGIRNNPDHARLADVVPAASYARWQVLKQRYMPHSHKVEKWRPLFAGFALYDAAIEQAGLSQKSVVVPALLRTARKHDIKVTNPSLKVVVSDPKSLVIDFRRERLHDVACFDLMLGKVDADVAHMRVRAQAWATGDLATLRQLRHRRDGIPCADALTGAAFARKLGLHDLPAQIRQRWLTVATGALANNTSTFAVVPMRYLLGPDDYLGGLAKAGYTIQAPDAPDPSDDPIDALAEHDAAPAMPTQPAPAASAAVPQVTAGSVTGDRPPVTPSVPRPRLP